MIVGSENGDAGIRMVSLPGNFRRKDVERRGRRVHGRFAGKLTLEISPAFPEAIRSHEDLSSRQRTGDPVVADRGQSHRSDAATLRAIGGSSKLAWSDPSLQIGGDDARGSCKNTFFWIVWWRRNLVDDSFVHIQFWVLDPQPPEFVYGGCSLRRIEYLRVGGAELRSEETEPHFGYFRLAGPECEKFVEVARTPCDL